MDKSLLIIVIHIVLIFTIITVITMFIRYNNAFKLDKRISSYSIKYQKDIYNMTLYDRLWNKYISFVKSKRRRVQKLFPIMVKRYDKYSVGSKYKAEDYLVHKFVISIIFTLLATITLSIQGRLIDLLELLINFIIGFYLLDIYLIVMNKINKRNIENDILRAVIIMNNAFRSGHTTIQAVEIASKKLDGAIGYEFKRIYEELKYGLSPDTVFNRFSKRVNLEEAEYLASSLTILQKTGGNIVLVFDSIEKTLFDKKKLNEELKNSTLVSKLVVRILLFVPIIFVLIIYFLNPDYFRPFISNPIGILLLGIIIFMFIMYMYILNRIVKVKY